MKLLQKNRGNPAKVAQIEKAFDKVQKAWYQFQADEQMTSMFKQTHAAQDPFVWDGDLFMQPREEEDSSDDEFFDAQAASSRTDAKKRIAALNTQLKKARTPTEINRIMRSYSQLKR